jgi:putative tricarboxylic transport membrane protein
MIWQPEREIEIIAGTPPGGGLDRSARALVKAITATGLLDVPVRVVNVGGEGGRKAWRHVEQHARDGHVIGISSPNMTADYLIGVTKSDPGRFAPLAILYSEYIAFVVRADSTIRGSADLTEGMAKNAVTIALSTSLGNSNHVAVANVVAGHADVGAITAASAVPELEANRLCAIAISSPTRLPGPYEAAPTWIEQSVDCVVGSWRGASGPPELGTAEIAFWQAMLAAATQSKEWKSDLERHFWTEMYLDGAELQQYLKRERSEMKTVLGELGLLGGGG